MNLSDIRVITIYELVCLCLRRVPLIFQVVSALREAGLESSNLILAIDFTKSNEWTGYSFGI